MRIKHKSFHLFSMQNLYFTYTSAILELQFYRITFFSNCIIYPSMFFAVRKYPFITFTISMYFLTLSVWKIVFKIAYIFCSTFVIKNSFSISQIILKFSYVLVSIYTIPNTYSMFFIIY